MGYDVTLHPINREEFKYFIEDVFDKPYLMDTKAEIIHNNEEERAHLIKSVYSNFPMFREQLIDGEASFEKTIGFAATAILGYLHPYWYMRNGLISNLLENAVFKELASNLSSIVTEENRAFFNSENGIEENYSSGVFIQNHHILSLLYKLTDAEFKHKIVESIGEENLEPLVCCLNYCSANNLDLIEATDLCVPLTGESYTFPSNLRAMHLNNISDYSNQSKKKNTLDISDSKIDVNWWNNLNNNWRKSVEISYRSVVAPKFMDNYSERNKHIETKFHKETLDLSGIDEFETISINILDQENTYSTITPFFDFPNLKNVNISSSLPIEFDLRRMLQFPQIERLGINQHSSYPGFRLTNFESLKELHNLRHLKLGDIGLKAAELKEINNFSQLISLSLAFAPYRSVRFLKGNTHLEALSLSYTKGLEDLSNLKRLHLFPKEKNPSIINCPNIKLISCFNSKRMTDLSSFEHLSKLETLIIRSSNKPIDLTLLNSMPSVKSFYVDKYTNLDSLSEPVESVQDILIKGNLDGKIKGLAKLKFPNGELKVHFQEPYE